MYFVGKIYISNDQRKEVSSSCISVKFQSNNAAQYFLFSYSLEDQLRVFCNIKAKWLVRIVTKICLQRKISIRNREPRLQQCDSWIGMMNRRTDWNWFSCNSPRRVPLRVKKMANLLSGLSKRPQPVNTSPMLDLFHSGFVAPSGHSKSCFFPAIQ
jgi:hypothetical protein